MVEQVLIDGGTSRMSDYPDVRPPHKYHILVDPGHGGRDPGAVGRVHGTAERDVVMQISQMMKELSEHGRTGILLTRRDNLTNRTIRERTTFPKTPKVDAFISLHCNAFTDTRVHGMEVFYWQDNVNGRRLSQFILSDVLRDTSWHSRGVKSTNVFGVLRRTPKLPSCLVEYNFISNHKMEEEFRDIDTLFKLASATYTAVERYLDLHGRT